MLTPSGFVGFLLLYSNVLSIRAVQLALEWLTETNVSLHNNIKGNCQTQPVADYSVPPAFSDTLYLSVSYPTRAELTVFQRLPTTLTRANRDLLKNAIAKDYDKWVLEKEMRWMVPDDHPGQNRQNCYDLTALASNGTTLDLYRKYKEVERTSYLLRGSYGVVSYLGTVAFECGYFKGHESCETKWDQGNDWWRKCSSDLAEHGLSWRHIWPEDSGDAKSKSGSGGGKSYSESKRYADGHPGLLTLPLSHKHDTPAVESSSHKEESPAGMLGIHSIPGGTLRTGVKRHHYLTADVRVKKNKQLFRKSSAHTSSDKADTHSNTDTDSGTMSTTTSADSSRHSTTSTSTSTNRETTESYQSKHELAQVIIRNATTRWDILDQPQLDGTYIFAPKYYRRVFIVPASWDYNYHHFIADSLARLIKHIQFLRENPDIYIHMRLTEEYEIHDSAFKRNAQRMRDNLCNLLGLPPSRFIWGIIFAEEIYIPRVLQCAYALSNPIELRLLAKELIAGSLKAVKEEKKKQKQQQPIIASSNTPTVTGAGGSTTSKRKNLIIQQRHTIYGDSDRDWSNATFATLAASFTLYFPEHNVIMLSSLATESPEYCLACEILTYAGASAGATVGATAAAGSSGSAGSHAGYNIRQHQMTDAASRDSNHGPLEVDVLVGPHGAGLTNLMFMQPDSLVVEILGDYKDVNMPLCGYYGPFSAIFGQHHYLYSYNHNAGERLSKDGKADEVARLAAEFYRDLKKKKRSKLNVTTIV